MRFKHAVWMLLPALALAAPAVTQAAAEPRYSYVELGYLDVDFDDAGDGDGYGVGGSFAVHPNIHLLADYQDVDLGGDADATRLSLGAGVNYALRPGLDLVGRLRYIDQEIDVGPRSVDEDGYGLEAGMRAMINPALELNGGIRYVDLDDEDDTSFYIGGLYDIVANFALGADIEVSDDVTAFFIKGRFYFPSAVTGR